MYRNADNPRNQGIIICFCGRHPFYSSLSVECIIKAIATQLPASYSAK